jgi:hypothetical protein
MQTHPPSIGNNVKLNPLDIAVDSLAYKNNFISLKAAEPSLGLPSGYTLTQKNSVHYFPVFAIANSYLESRKFTGSDNLTFVNKNLGYNTQNPTFNIDISGTFHALSAYIENLSANYIIPASGSNTLTFNYEKVNFNTNVYFNNDTFVKNITSNNLFTEFLSANEKITTTIYEIYQLTGAYVDHDVIIAGNLTATNVFAVSSIITPFLSAASAYFVSLTAINATITNNLSVGGNVYANKIYGKIDIDPFSQLYYNNNNQLSINPNQDYVFAVRPSDEYSTDDINMPRTLNGDWWSNYNQILEDVNVSKPYFKNLQPVFDYIYKNGILGNSLTIYIDEDIIEGELKINGEYPYATTPYDNSGSYAGCTTKGNLSAGFYSTEWLGSNYPNLTAAGIFGGDFLWGYDNNVDMKGTFSYVDIPPIKFQNINIYGRYEIGSITRNDGFKYYSLSGRRFTDPPKKISFRTYVCSEPRLAYGTFTNQVSTWKSVKTKNSIQGRSVSFKHDTNLSLNNLCFEFNTNSNDYTGLLFYDGQTRISNVTISLLGNGVYTYGALNLNSPNCYFHVCGTPLGDPSVFNPTNWNNWSYSGYNYGTPNYYPGYGIAIVGNPNASEPTIVSYGANGGYTGLINVNNGAFFDLTDYDIARKIGRYSYLQSSIILDGRYNAYCYYQIGDNARIQGTEHLFTTNNLDISTKNLNANNTSFTTPSYNLQLFDNLENKINFKYINFAGSFSTLNIKYYGYTIWTFKSTEGLVTNYRNSYLNLYKGNSLDYYYTFNNISKTINLSNSLASIGHLNKLSPNGNYNSDYIINYVGISDLYKYDERFKFISPFDNTKTYTLNFYTSSVR